jgi:hypothetical protein
VIVAVLKQIRMVTLWYEAGSPSSLWDCESQQRSTAQLHAPLASDDPEVYSIHVRRRDPLRLGNKVFDISNELFDCAERYSIVQAGSDA